jgi:alkylation response protein AidB-like acyl-CoA dehydrogenase
MSRKLFEGGSYLVSDTVCQDVFIPEEFNDEQRQMSETTEQFIQNEVMPQLDEIENKNYDITIDLLKQAGELGLLLTDVPEEYGGLELDKTTSMLIAEKMGGRSGSFGLTANCHTGIGTLPLIYYGTAQQKECYLEKLAYGQIVGAYCLTEPGAGSDAMSAKTTATLTDDGKHYIVNGTKQFITNGGFADLFTVFAKIDGKQFTAFLVERGFEGVEIGPEEKKMGLNGSSTTQVIFTNVKVPVENILGEIAKGHKIAFNILNVGRLKLGVVASGMSKLGLSEAARYANERKQFGRQIGNFGAIKEKLADITATIFSSESMVYRISGMIDTRLEGIEKGIDNYYDEYQKGIEEYAAECAMAKVYGSDSFAFVADESLQVFGGYGYIREYEVEGLYRGERLQRIYEGTNEINRMIVPNTLFKRAFAGKIELFEEAKQAFADIAAGNVSTADIDSAFANEKALLKNLKAVVVAMYAAAAEIHKDKLAEEQELLLALADVSIELFALESAVLRGEKLLLSTTDSKAKVIDAVVRVAAFRTNEKFKQAARRVVCFMDGQGSSAVLSNGVDAFCHYEVKGLLQAKRLLAEATSDRERYLFDFAG